VCAPATYNDPRRDANGRGADTKGCPSTFSAFYARVKFVNGDDNCSSDSDCNVGTDAGRCATDPTAPRLRDGGTIKSCLCTVGSPVEQCPNTPDAGADGGGGPQVFSFCKFGNPGETQACMATVSCMPSNSYVFRDAGPPLNGCGL
jgi:hypothetical protein